MTRSKNYSLVLVGFRCDVIQGDGCFRKVTATAFTCVVPFYIGEWKTFFVDHLSTFFFSYLISKSNFITFNQQSVNIYA